MIIKKFILFILAFLSLNLLYTENFYINYSVQDKFRMTMRSNVRIYRDNRYVGLYTTELKGVLEVIGSQGGKSHVQGPVYRLQKGFRGNTEIGSFIDNIDATDFEIGSDGTITVIQNNFFPFIKGIPYFPNQDIAIGTTYQHYGSIPVFAENPDSYQVFRILISTVYRGKERFMDQVYDYFEISFGYYEPIAQGDIVRVRGLNRVRLFFDNVKHVPVYMDQHFDDTLTLRDNSTIVKKGFNLYFFAPVEPIDRIQLLAMINDQLDSSTSPVINNSNLYGFGSSSGTANVTGSSNYLDGSSINTAINNITGGGGTISGGIGGGEYTVIEREDSISISINNLNFRANSVELMSGEETKITTMINLLKETGNRTIMVVGHTALFGSREEQMRLSTDRAKAISAILAAGGIPPARLSFIGKGAEEPIAPNDTEANMRLNRRVEIRIMED